MLSFLIKSKFKFLGMNGSKKGQRFNQLQISLEIQISKLVLLKAFSEFITISKKVSVNENNKHEVCI